MSPRHRVQNFAAGGGGIAPPVPTGTAVTPAVKAPGAAGGSTAGHGVPAGGGGIARLSGPGAGEPATGPAEGTVVDPCGRV